MSDIEVSDWVECDYPTDAALAKIEAWPWEDAAGLLDFVRAIWHWPEFGVSDELRPHEAEVVHAEPEDRFLRLATGGWSGNESIIGALDRNVVAIAMLWCLSSRGGLHIYKYPATK